MSKFRQQLSYANVTATLALFLALGGVGYAAGRIHGSELKNRTVKGVKLKRDTVTGRELRERSLREVPRARRARIAGTARAADRAGIADALAESAKAQVRLRCMEHPNEAASICFETEPRSPEVFNLAVLTCNVAGGGRLPTYSELLAFASRDDIAIATGGELTSDLVRPEAPSPTRQLDVIVMTHDTGKPEYVNAGGTESPRPFRCVTPKAN